MKKFFLLAFSLFLLVACERVELPGELEKQVPSFDFKVPEGFSWDLHKTIDVSVGIADQYDGKLNYCVEIYDGEKLLDKGFVNGAEEYSTFVVVENITTVLTIVQLDPNGKNAVKMVSFDGETSVNVDFNAPVEPVSRGSVLSRSGVPSRSGVSSIQIPSDAILMTGNMTTLESDKVYVLRSTYSAHVKKANNVTLYLDYGGVFRVEKGSELSNSTIHILAGGRLVGQTSVQHQNLHITNYVGGEINIYGDLEMKGGSFTNYSDAFYYNMYLEDVTLKTDGLLLIGVRRPDELTGGVDDLGSNDYTGVNFGTETGRVELKNTTVSLGDHFAAEDIVSEGGSITFDPHAWINVVNRMKCTNTIITGSTVQSESAVIKAKAISLDTKDNVKGRIVLDTEDGISLNNGNDHWGEDVNHGATNPNDKTSIAAVNHLVLKYNDKGYNAVFPENPELPTGPQYFSPKLTILMEDSAPGDMDMNDMVCDWLLGTVKNDKNQVTTFGIRYSITALGALNNLAGAVALRGSAIVGNIKNITFKSDEPGFTTPSFTKYFTVSNGLEVNNNDVVIPLFEDAHQAFFNMPETGFVNTFEVTEESYTFDVEIELNSPIEIEELLRKDIDFFLVISGDMNKRVETHLHGNPLTSKASNTNVDFANEQFVAGVELVEGFSYARELIPIQDAYPNFRDWVTSGGMTNQDWYKFPVDENVMQRRRSD